MGLLAVSNSVFRGRKAAPFSQPRSEAASGGPAQQRAFATAHFSSTSDAGGS